MTKTLIVSNSVNPLVLREAAFVRRYLSRPYEIRNLVYDPRPVDSHRYARIILMGSEADVGDGRSWMRRETELIREAAEREIPLLGVCFGHQLIAHAFGGSVGRAKQPELGWFAQTPLTDRGLFDKMPDPCFAMCTHMDEVKTIPAGFALAARSDRCTVAGMVHETKPIWTVQFHPEIDPRNGLLLLSAMKIAHRSLPVDPLTAWRYSKDSGFGPVLFSQFEAV